MNASVHKIGGYSGQQAGRTLSPQAEWAFAQLRPLIGGHPDGAVILETALRAQLERRGLQEAARQQAPGPVSPIATPPARPPSPAHFNTPPTLHRQIAALRRRDTLPPDLDTGSDTEGAASDSDGQPDPR